MNKKYSQFITRGGKSIKMIDVATGDTRDFHRVIN